MQPPSPVANQGKLWETTCTVALKYYNYLYIRNKSPPKLAKKDPPYKNRIPPAHEVSLCLELACSHVLCYKLWVFGLILCPNHQEPGSLCPPVTDIDASIQFTTPREEIYYNEWAHIIM